MLAIRQTPFRFAIEGANPSGRDCLLSVHAGLQLHAESAAGRALAQPLKGDVQHRYEKGPNQLCYQHAAKKRCADGAPA